MAAATQTQETKLETKQEIYLGAVIEINEKPINLIPSTPINQIETKGLKLSLDKAVELGTLGKAMASLCKDMGIDDPLSEEKIKKIDTPLFKNLAEKTASANMRIEALKYEQPPVKEDEKGVKTTPPSKYVFVASVNWDKNSSDTAKDFFKLRGLIVGISSGFTDDKTGENLEVQQAFLSALQAIPSVGALPPSAKAPTTSDNASGTSTTPDNAPEEK
jgi:hypothetical protein